MLTLRHLYNTMYKPSNDLPFNTVREEIFINRAFMKAYPHIRQPLKAST